MRFKCVNSMLCELFLNQGIVLKSVIYYDQGGFIPGKQD